MTGATSPTKVLSSRYGVAGLCAGIGQTRRPGAKLVPSTYLDWLLQQIHGGAELCQDNAEISAVLFNNVLQGHSQTLAGPNRRSSKLSSTAERHHERGDTAYGNEGVVWLSWTISWLS